MTRRLRGEYADKWTELKYFKLAKGMGLSGSRALKVHKAMALFHQCCACFSGVVGIEEYKKSGLCSRCRHVLEEEGKVSCGGGSFIVKMDDVQSTAAAADTASSTDAY